MANQLSGNPWTLDTVSATPFWTGLIDVEHFEMVDYPVETDTVTVKDGFGRTVWEGNGAFDFSDVRSGKIGAVHGMAFTQSSNAATRVRVHFR